MNFIKMNQTNGYIYVRNHPLYNKKIDFTKHQKKKSPCIMIGLCVAIYSTKPPYLTLSNFPFFFHHPLHFQVDCLVYPISYVIF